MNDIKQFSESLEKLVDKHGLYAVISELSNICFEKKEHVLTNWQDEGLAELWEFDRKLLDKTSIKIKN